MKSGKIALILVGMFLLLNACTTVKVVQTNPNGKVPPGQQKKTTGTQSAKTYAPGQQKKTTGTQSAKTAAPGQQKKTTGAQSPKTAPPGQQKKK